MVDESWLSRSARAVQTRHLHGTPQEDERTRHGRAGGLLLVLGAGTGMGLLPVLPARIDHLLAFLLSVGCLALGLVVPWLPWERLPRWTLLTPVVATLPVVFGGGGFVDGTLDFYALFLPLVFIYLGLVFPPVYSWWTFVVCMVGLALSLTGAQSAEVVPFVIMTAILASVCGGVLAMQRRTEARGYQAMRALAEAATLLGAANDRQQVADVVAVATADLLDVEDVEVLLLFDTEPTAVVSRRGATPAPEVETGSVLARAQAVLASLAVGQSSSSLQLVVAIPGPAGPRGAIVVEQHRRVQGSDRFAARSLDVLAGEAGHVLDRIRRTEELVTSSRTDALTGLGNRTVLKEALEASTPGDVFVLMDLDHFKRVNDTLGHAMGDQVLVAFAGVLRSAVRLNQVVARYGGEEFATILPQADDFVIERHLQNVRQAWADLNPLVTFSSGIAVRLEGESHEAAMARADNALYLAKNGGRDQDVRDPGVVLSEATSLPGST
ncbi:GGDEF domain-containing protein [Nocardioides sp.]|uniref:GGDEF domain-containing protein n=1 Tax=Nocardioides sp. TaxID=35761 RepID=UPI002C0EE2C4|nr:GGDEF domain-containing protein [Nocardioides sp.]HXH79251.1 GGDEF domain-containing protein [Nocardioides sp.]